MEKHDRSTAGQTFGTRAAGEEMGWAIRRVEEAEPFLLGFTALGIRPWRGKMWILRASFCGSNVAVSGSAQLIGWAKSGPKSNAQPQPPTPKFHLDR